MSVVTFLSAPAAALTVLLAIVGQAETGLKLFGQSLEIVLAMTHYFYNLSPGVVRLSVPMPPVSLVFLSLALAAMMAFAGCARLVGGVLLLVPAIWLWSEAPRVVLHWSVSGDVFIANEVGMVERLELTDGDGLAPLRFSEVPDTASCGLEECLYKSFCGLTVQTIGKPNEEKEETGEATSQLIVGIRGASPSASELRFNWEDVRKSGGITVHKKDGQLTVVQTKSCTDRPWRQCSNQSLEAQSSGGVIAYFRRLTRNVE